MSKTGHYLGGGTIIRLDPFGPTPRKRTKTGHRAEKREHKPRPAVWNISPELRARIRETALVHGRASAHLLELQYVREVVRLEIEKIESLRGTKGATFQKNRYRTFQDRLGIIDQAINENAVAHPDQIKMLRRQGLLLYS